MSNPSELTEWVGAANHPTLALAASANPRVIARDIYATVAGALTGTLYLITSIGGNAATTFTDNPSLAQDTSQALDWGPGGWPSSGVATLVEDHTPPPPMTLLSTAMHGVMGEAGTPGSGILFGLEDDGCTVRWSMLGFPQYWPTRNFHKLPERVYALVTSGQTTYAITDSAAWAFTGAADDTIERRRVEAEVGILVNAGLAAVATPMGVLFPSRLGLAALTYDGVRILTEGIIRPETIASATLAYTHATWYDGAYTLFGATDSLIFDFRNGPTPIITKCTVTATASHVTPFNPTSSTAGMHIVSGTPGVPSTSIKPWRPVDGTGVTGAARLDWYLYTPRFSAPNPGSFKKWHRGCWSGTAYTLSTYLDGGSAFQTGITADGWLKAATQGNDIQFKIANTNGNAATAVYTGGYVQWGGIDAA